MVKKSASLQQYNGYAQRLQSSHPGPTAHRSSIFHSSMDRAAAFQICSALKQGTKIRWMPKYQVDSFSGHAKYSSLRGSNGRICT